MSKRNELVPEHEPHYIRSSSRNSRDLFPSDKAPSRTYKDFVSYSSQVDNSSSHSDLPNKALKRSSKITSLQQEFQDLKRKIREVENKNEKIIEKIHFGKDAQKRRSDEQHNLSGYEHEQGKIHSQIIPPPTKNKWPPVPLPQKGKIPISSFYDSQPELKSQAQLRAKDPYAVRRTNQSVDIGTPNEDSREKNRLKVDLQALEDKCNKEQAKLQHVRNHFKNYSDCVKLIIENQLGQFMENLERAVHTIEGKNNKNRDKLNRLQGRLAVSKGSAKRRNKLSSSFDLGSRRGEKLQTGGSEISKTKAKQFEALINKYQQILRSKNEEMEKLGNQIKLKERELMQIRDKLEEVKQEKRRMGHEHDEMVAKLQGKIQALSEVKPSDTKRKQLINLAASKEKEKHRQKEKDKQKQETTEKYLKQVRILESKLSFTETRLEQKAKAVEQMQRQVKSINENKMSLINEYQETLQRTRNSHKNKYQQLLSTIQSLKSSIRSKEQTISRQIESYKQLEHRYIEVQIELNTVNQKLLLKEDIEKLQRSAIKRANEIQLNMPLQTLSSTSQGSIKLVDILEKEKRELQLNYDKLRGEFQIYKLSSKSMGGVEDIIREKDNIIKDLRSKIQKPMLSSTQSTFMKLKQTNLLQSSMGMSGLGAENTQDLKRRVRNLDQEVSRLKNVNEELKRQNIGLNSKLIGLGHDVTLNEQLHKQQQDKTKELKLYIEELERMVNELQKIVQEKTRQLQTQKQSYQKQLAAIQNELKVMEDQFAIINSQLIKETDKVNIKVMEVKHLQDQIQDLRVQIIKLNQEKQALVLKLEDMQEDTKKQWMMDSRVNEEYKQDILKLKEQIEKLYMENTALTQSNKHQKAKIEELELEVFTDGHQQDECMSQTSDIKTQTLATKLKTLQTINLEHDIAKANLERHLKNSEENNTKLMQEVSDLLAELEKKKSEFNSTIITYDQKIHQLEEMLQAAEKTLRQKQREREEHHYYSNLITMPNERVYRSDLRSQSSLMFSNTSQLYGDKEIDFRLSDDGGSEVGEINVEAIFNNTNYPYQNIKLRRKDQIEFIKNTAQLINRLKSTINQKNRKIKALQKKVAPVKDGNQFGGKQTESLKSDDFDDIDDFNENYSVRFDDRKQDRNRKIRQLENETHLVMEENNLLLQQVTSLQDQLQKSEEQQNNLVRLKQILKEEVKKLQKALDQKQVLHQQQIQRLHKVIQENQAVHNSQTMRILLPKIFGIVCNQDNMRREEKRRELEEYIKIVATILKIEATPIRYSGRR